MSEIASITSAARQVQTADTTPAAPPKGVGTLKSVWLNMTGQATSTQSKQLSSLREYVDNRFGYDGLKFLDNWQADHVKTASKDGGHWSTVLSTSEIRGLISDLETNERVQELSQSSVDIVSSMPKARLILLKHVMSEFSEQNVTFLSKFNAMPMQEFQAAAGNFPDARLNEFPDNTLRQMMMDYVSTANGNDPAFGLNLPYDTRQDAQLAYDAFDQALAGGNQAQINAAKRYLIDALDDCRIEIKNLVNLDTLGRLRDDPVQGPLFFEALDQDLRNFGDPDNIGNVPAFGDPTTLDANQIDQGIEDLSRYHVLKDALRDGGLI
ncbi:MAG: hypothetical protein AAGE89_15910 [Pseudomonadota bacterium]